MQGIEEGGPFLLQGTEAGEERETPCPLWPHSAGLLLTGDV